LEKKENVVQRIQHVAIVGCVVTKEKSVVGICVVPKMKFVVETNYVVQDQKRAVG
jgi:hypothetical protein